MKNNEKSIFNIDENGVLTGLCGVLNIPEGVEIKNWMEVESPVDKWLDIIQYGLSIKRE